VPLAALSAYADLWLRRPAVLPNEAWTLASVDPSIDCICRPQAEWTLTEAESETANGSGTARGRLSDRDGFCGRSVQTTFLARQ
jgi:hypothetical protein